MGACTGSYSEAVLELSPNAQIHAFEPSPKSLDILNEKFHKSEQVNIYPFALGEKIPKEFYTLIQLDLP